MTATARAGTMLSTSHSTPEDVLARLQSAAPEGGWVKGAVNFDEDLHFSTYYLRASCAPWTGDLYPGYSSLVASYEGFNETYWLHADECRRTSVALVDRALREPAWLPGVLEEIRVRSDVLAAIFRPAMTPESFTRLSTAALLALYRRHDARTRELYVPARLPEALDRGVSHFTGYLHAHLHERGLSEAEAAREFAVLSEPSVPSVLAREIVEFDEIVQIARADAGVVAAAKEAAGRVRMRLSVAVVERLEAHQRKWKILAYHGYGRRALSTLDEYTSRLVEQLRGPRALADCPDLVARGERAEREKRALLRSLRLDPAHAALFRIYSEIGSAKLYRRAAQLRNFYFLDMMLAEIARRLDVIEWTVRCMRPEEVIASLRAARLCDPTIRERLDGCVLAIADGQERVLTGADAARALSLVRPRAARRGTGPLRGTVACRGKAAGPCKIVIRAEDCERLPEGAILVSESTDPDLVRHLRAAAAVLTEQGGVTSHAAIICRELGVPTIIGVDGLLERVRDGDWVEVDAVRGIVTVGRRAVAARELPADAGEKARNLERARSLGFRVPDFTVIDFERVRVAAGRADGRALRLLARRVVAELGLPAGDLLAVRSSAIAEDRADGSGAGQFTSLLGVGQERLAAALRAFIEANRASRLGVEYRGSVIVQRMVAADVAGVCLTRDGRTGRGDALIIEMAPGGNAGVTGGTACPDRVVVDRLTGDILEETRSDAARARAIDVTGLAREMLRLEAGFGAPLDIEWALLGRELAILQARPIVGDARGAACVTRACS